MKKLVIFVLLLTGCAVAPMQPFSFPAESHITCFNDICCYPMDNKTLACVSTNYAYKSVVFYIKILDK